MINAIQKEIHDNYLDLKTGIYDVYEFIHHISLKISTMANLKNTWTAEEGEAIMNHIIKGDSAEVAKAKVMIDKDQKLGKDMAELYVPNIMTTDRAEAYKALSDDMVANKKAMIDLFGEDNYKIYNMASKKNKIDALVYGKKNPKVGFQTKKSTGCYGIES